MKKAAEEGLKQIKERKYKQELIAREIENIIEIGIAFEGKDVMVLT